MSSVQHTLRWCQTLLIVIRQVQLGNLEDAAHVPLGSHIIGTRVGNYMWRSPESHVEAGLGKPSDMFSFGVVVNCETPELLWVSNPALFLY